ncbi:MULTISPECIES: hypothetical protein [Pseudomonas fluorescens group]|uniref:PBS lyase n=1 Tax=Pseudomonas gessardii TaxID=78544 RepID=A0ABS9FH82_9PSED|nr:MULTISPECIES: hypothetical protein [Pseudomonas fluorescens group]VVO20053.1 hypothetical protein PS706_04180 [Pseudomonas fluorescens]KAA8553814.1 hypothetical protein FX984_00424 [Pseudomonas marginalis]MCF4982152.1 hypothetical protein [Pseudomonas gessardii]MCF4991830.1 hypothetical protein [Pseudomonas gessardii]MCF5088182.1 hypothetical protein [Pseudomonas gessardii]
MTTPSREDIIGAAANGGLIDLIFKDSWRYDTAPFSQSLIDAHNAKEIDLRALLPQLEPSRSTGNEWYLGTEILLPALSSLATSCADLLELIAGAIPYDDPMLSHSSYAVIVNWCQASQERLVELLHLIKSGAPLTQRFHCVQACISAGLKSDAEFYLGQALELLHNGDAPQRAQAARALCNLSAEVRSSDAGLVDTLLAVVERETESTVRDALLTLALAWHKDAPSELHHSTYELITQAASPVTLTAKQTIARELLGNSSPYTVQVRRDLLALVASGQPEDEIVQLLDVVLAGLIRNGEVLVVRQVIEKFILDEPGVPFTRFSSVLRQLESGDNTVLDEWVVSWLQSGSVRLSTALRRGLFAACEGRIFTFDFRLTLDVPDSDYLYIARKALGVFFSKPVYMASLIVSLMRNAEDATMAALQSLLFDPVLINYSGLRSDYLDKIAADATDPASRAVEHALLELQMYLDGLGNAHIRELQPSERERQLEHHRRNEEMQSQMVEARKSSFIASLGSEKILLYGTGMASWIPEFPPPQGVAEGEPGPMRRMEQSLATIQHSFQLARHSVLEPSTLELQILNFLYETRSQ